MPATPNSERTPDKFDDLEGDLSLPPPDATDDDELTEEAIDELPIPLNDEGLDDTAATDLDVGQNLLDEDEPSSQESSDEVDVGPLDEGLLVNEDSTHADDPEGFTDDKEIEIDEVNDEGDEGDEGTSDDLSVEIDEATLPALGDDDGEDSENMLATELLAEASTHPRAHGEVR